MAQDQSSPGTCDEGLGAAGSLDAVSLKSGADTCYAAGRLADSHYLWTLGEARSAADIDILHDYNAASLTLVEQVARTDAPFYAEPDHLIFYRDPGQVTMLIEQLLETDLIGVPEYSPGWSYTQPQDPIIYEIALKNALNRQIWFIQNWAARMQNDTYFAAHQALSAYQSTYDFETRTEDQRQRSLELAGEVSDTHDGIDFHPKPERIQIPFKYLPAYDASWRFEQIGQGLNGPEEEYCRALHTRERVEASWLASAYSAEELDTLLSDVDFEGGDVVTVCAAGKTINASEQMRMMHVGFIRVYSLGAAFGVVPDHCSTEQAVSYPFVVAKYRFEGYGAHFANQWPRGVTKHPVECQPVMSSEPTPMKD